MAMKRGLSYSSTLGDDQYILNSELDLEAGNDRTKDLETWKNILTKLKIPFVTRSTAFMIDDDNLDT